MTENMVSMIKMKCIYRKTFKARKKAKLEIFDNIGSFSNQLRIYFDIGYMSPVEYEPRMPRESISA